MKIEAAVCREEFAAAYLRSVGSSQIARDDGRLKTEDYIKTVYGIYEKLIEGSKRANLTAILSSDGVAERHILDSLIPYLFLEKRGIVKDGVRIADVGCGAGFPTLPIASFAASCGTAISVTAIDSTAKKTRFLRETADALGIPGIEVVTGRAEELASPGGKYRERFDVTVARAVAPLRILLELTAPFVRRGGFVTAYKGRGDEEKDAAAIAEKLGLSAPEKIVYSLPSGDERTLFIYEKTAATPAAYPRTYAKIVSDKYNRI
ncbi:MAG: 16S rRNA (guanine(527)-N(7))-methyltransferase RsmG [Clostridia bacterium]|nr:16S rRNA (guanine(527)-N(7))-methyltransferase RsmG [Clostridia bacterium]